MIMMMMTKEELLKATLQSHHQNSNFQVLIFVKHAVGIYPEYSKESTHKYTKPDCLLELSEPVFYSNLLEPTQIYSNK